MIKVIEIRKIINIALKFIHPRVYKLSIHAFIIGQRLTPRCFLILFTTYLTAQTMEP